MIGQIVDIQISSVDPSEHFLPGYFVFREHYILGFGRLVVSDEQFSLGNSAFLRAESDIKGKCV